MRSLREQRARLLSAAGEERLYKFPTTIGAERRAALLFVGINPRKSGSNSALHEHAMSDVRTFDELSRNWAFGEKYIAAGGKEKHYRTHARIAEAALTSAGASFERIAACTELFLCATKDATQAITALCEMV